MTKVITPHHNALVISLTVMNLLVKRMLVDNRDSTNMIFLDIYNDLGLHKDIMTRKATPQVSFNRKVKNALDEVTLHVYTEGRNMSTKFMVVDSTSSYSMIMLGKNMDTQHERSRM
ncbi:hypothetical protein F2Q68_00021317 [Brassica cretica]|uniref:Uncharacterized protein n=1 Tax=Brassica cretica TaxID=69181 RepID=A0A8S9FQW2_BRACR|nr:hypothetical protein F2Q68_00021317 [Brassica cretica]